MPIIPLIGPDGQLPPTTMADLLSKVKELSKKNVSQCKKISDFTVTSIVSHSHDTYVAKVEDKESGQEYVLKKLKYSKNSQVGIPLNAIREIGILKKLEHINIVSIQGFVIDQSTPFKNYIQLECCREDVTKLLENTSKLEESEIKCLLKMLLDGLSYLYDKLIMHRDICPRNLLIHSSGILKIADFGKARLCEKTNHDEMDVEFPANKIGTPGYRAPELILNHKNYNRSIDMWSFGCVCGELFNHKPIFNIDKHDDRQLHNIIKLCGSPDSSYYSRFNENSLLATTSLPVQGCDTFFETFPDICVEGIQLLQKCFQYDWNTRIKPEDCLKEKYFDIEPKALTPEHLFFHLSRKRTRDFTCDSEEIELNSVNLLLENASPSSLSSGASDKNAGGSSGYPESFNTHYYREESLDSLSEGEIADTP